MEAKKIQFDDGVKTYSVNGRCEISFNPIDDVFIHELTDHLAALKSIYEFGEAESRKAGDDVEAQYKLAQQRVKKVRAEIDGIFGAGVPAKVLGKNPCAVSGGIPIWMHFLLAVMEIVDEEITEAGKEQNDAFKKYEEKFRKYSRGVK